PKFSSGNSPSCADCSALWRSRLERRLVCLGSGPTSPPIGQALSFDATQSAVCALGIIHAQLGAVRVSKVKLGKVSVQMLLAAVLIHTLHAALEHAVVVL